MGLCFERWGFTKRISSRIFASPKEDLNLYRRDFSVHEFFDAKDKINQSPLSILYAAVKIYIQRGHFRMNGWLTYERNK